VVGPDRVALQKGVALDLHLAVVEQRQFIDQRLPADGDPRSRTAKQLNEFLDRACPPLEHAVAAAKARDA
jgi:hypothetical protein